jgi:hypothetical protein
MTRTALVLAALLSAGGVVYGQDKGKPKKEDQQDQLLREVDKRLKTQKDDILRAVEKLLDDRLGKGPQKHEEKGGPGKRQLPPGLAMQRRHPAPGLAKKREMEKPGKKPGMQKHKKLDERGKKKGKQDEDD